ncbi:MAG: DUF2029 domain-containing protein [Pseudonocardiaceae bacterium]|nr:DUF2029 domain-containing protein [Pseudonocardiaceae bacterium]
MQRRVQERAGDVVQAPADGYPTGEPSARRTIPLRVGVLAVLVSLGLHAVTVAVWPAYYNVYIDTEVYQAAGRALLAGRDLYSEPLVEPGIHSLYHVYTPFAAALFTPLVLVPLPLLDYLGLALNLVLLTVVVRVSMTATGSRVPVALPLLVASLAFWLEPVRTTAWLGQINLLLMLLVLLDLPRGPSRWPPGLGIGLASGIKLTPLLFIPYLVLTGRRREAAVASVTALGTVGVGYLVAPQASVTYWSGVVLESTRIAEPTMISNQSLRGMLARIGDGSVPGGLGVWFVLAGVLAVAGLTVAVRLWRAGDHVLGTALCGLTTSIVSPFSWGHHWVWFVPLLAVLCLEVYRTGDRRSAAGAAALLLAAGSVLYGIRSDGTPAMGMFLIEGAGPFGLLTHNIYCWIYLAILAYAVTLVRNRSRSTVAG